MKNDEELCEWLRANSSDTYQAADRIQALLCRNAELVVRNAQLEEEINKLKQRAKSSHQVSTQEVERMRKNKYIRKGDTK